MADKDIEFTFDAAGFNKAILSMMGKIGELGKTSAKGSSESADTTAKGVTKWMMNFTILSGAIKGIMGSVKEFIPEIGQTLETSKNIIAKNFMMPLRKEMLPILQGVLNWVR